MLLLLWCRFSVRKADTVKLIPNWTKLRVGLKVHRRRKKQASTWYFTKDMYACNSVDKYRNSDIAGSEEAHRQYSTVD